GSDDIDEHGTGSGSGSGKSNRPKTPTAPKHPPVAAATNVADLKKQAMDLEKAQDWDNAKLIWEKLEKNKQYPFQGFAVYKQAWAAFQSGDANTTLSLAQKAAAMKGNQVLDAQELVGDALYKLTEYERAKTFYIAVRGKVTGQKK